MVSTPLRTFTARDLDNTTEATFEIKFISENRYKDAINFMNKFFLAQEPMARVRKFQEDKGAMEENEAAWMEILSKEKISIACFKGDEIVAVNFLYVKKMSNKDESEIKSKNFRDIINAMKFVEMKRNVSEIYNVDEYLAAMGLGVHPAYQKRGIATQMLKARENVMKILNLKLTSTQFTGEISQKAAMRAGYEENFCVTYEEMVEADKELEFPGIDAKCIKTMSLKI